MVINPTPIAALNNTHQFIDLQFRGVELKDVCFLIQGLNGKLKIWLKTQGKLANEQQYTDLNDIG